MRDVTRNKLQHMRFTCACGRNELVRCDLVHSDTGPEPMTIRDEFAKAAMSSIMRADKTMVAVLKTSDATGVHERRVIASVAYAQADAMMRQRMEVGDNA